MRRRQFLNRVAATAIMAGAPAIITRAHKAEAAAPSRPSRWAEKKLPEPKAAAGWKLGRLTAASTLYNANGMIVGPDKKLYICEQQGWRLSRCDREGHFEVFVPAGGITTPDDIAFDQHGNCYTTDAGNATVWTRRANGEVKAYYRDIKGANGICNVGDRIICDEFSPGGRVLELYPDGRPPRVLCDGLKGGNAMQQGPDGRIYFTQPAVGEVWAVPLEGGKAELIVTDVDNPSALKFMPDGTLAINSRFGEVVGFDLKTKQRWIRGKVPPRQDNLAVWPDGTIFTSSGWSGSITELKPDGKTRYINPHGLQGPSGGIAVLPNGEVHVADRSSLRRVAKDGSLVETSISLQPNQPGDPRGLASAGDGNLWVGTPAGVALFDPVKGQNVRTVAKDLKGVEGVKVINGALVVVQGLDAGRVVSIDANEAVTELAAGLKTPIDVAASGKTLFVSELETGRVVKIGDNKTVTTLADGLGAPQGVAATNDDVFVVDGKGRQLWAVSIASGQKRVVASNLPLGNPAGYDGKRPRTYSGLYIEAKGRILIGADGDGSIHTLTRA